MRRERLVELLVQLPCRVVGHVQKRGLGKGGAAKAQAAGKHGGGREQRSSFHGLVPYRACATDGTDASLRLSSLCPSSGLPVENSRMFRCEERREGKECVRTCGSRWTPTTK